MCTASWSSHKAGYSFLFSRDEQRTRPRAHFPQESSVQGVRFLSPKDPKGGGSWIIANEFGLVVSLLNHYAASDAYALENAKTRGEIPIRLANCDSVESVFEVLQQSDLSGFMPFHVCCLGKTGSGRVCSWDGRRLSERDLAGRCVMTTSSFNSDKVQPYREQLYDSLPHSTGLELYSFHTNATHSDSAFNPIMSRADAKTQSICTLELSDDLLTFSYAERVEDKPEFTEVSRASLVLK